MANQVINSYNLFYIFLHVYTYDDYIQHIISLLACHKNITENPIVRTYHCHAQL